MLRCCLLTLIVYEEIFVAKAKQYLTSTFLWKQRKVFGRKTKEIYIYIYIYNTHAQKMHTSIYVFQITLSDLSRPFFCFVFLPDFKPSARQFSNSVAHVH